MECVYCRSLETEILNTSADFSICRCKSCGTLFSDVSVDTKGFYYESPPSPAQSFIRRRLSNIMKGITAEFYFQYLGNHIDLSKAKSVLDVGADRGHFVSLFERISPKAVGIEADRMRAANPVAADLRVGFFDKDYEIDGSFDLVCFTQNMYYFRDNRGVLENAVSLLNEKGHLFIATVNGDSPAAIRHFSRRGNPYNCACLLSKKGWEDVCKLFQLHMVDCSYYEQPMMKDLGDGKWHKLAKYWLFPSSSQYKTDSSGHYMFLILGK